MSDDIKQAAEEVSFAELLDSSEEFVPHPPRRGEIRQAIVLQIERNEILVDLGAKRDGYVTSKDIEHLDPQVRDSLVVGGQVPVYVINPNDSNDNLIVSINMGLQQYDWDEARALLESDDVVEVSVAGYNRGGVLVKWKRLDGFIPSSHMVTVSSGLQGTERKDAIDDIMSDKLGVKVIEVDQTRRRLIFSEREAQREWRAQQKARLLSELKEGDVVDGEVTGLRDFGAFVNIGGADGLIHVSELAWHRVDHPRDVLNIGDVIEVYVLSLDRKTNRIALSRKRLLNDPWEKAMEKYYEGQQVEGNVTNVVDFGAFIALDDGLEGLLHLSEMGDGTLKEPHSYVKKGDRLQLRISRLEPEKRRVGFTQRWGTDQPILSNLDQDGNVIEDETIEDEEDVEDIPEVVAEEVSLEVVAEEAAAETDDDNADEATEEAEDADDDNADEATEEAEDADDDNADEATEEAEDADEE